MGGDAEEAPPDVLDRLAAPVFGVLALTPDGDQRFTSDWDRHRINFFEDIVDHHEVP
jgi:hypothetical protein